MRVLEQTEYFFFEVDIQLVEISSLELQQLHISKCLDWEISAGVDLRVHKFNISENRASGFSGVGNIDITTLLDVGCLSALDEVKSVNWVALHVDELSFGNLDGFQQRSQTRYKFRRFAVEELDPL